MTFASLDTDTLNGQGPPDEAEPVLEQLLKLVTELTNERADQLKLVEAILSTLKAWIDEQSEMQRDVAHLRMELAAFGLHVSDSPANGRSDERRALREQTHQAQQHSWELFERATALLARASTLIELSSRLRAELSRPVARRPLGSSEPRRRRDRTIRAHPRIERAGPRA